MATKLVEKRAGFESVEFFKDQVIGIGAFGAVCHAQCDDLPCAAKILHQTIFSIAGQHKKALQFEQECKFIRTIQHPNIVQYLGVHYDDITGQPVLLMEMMDENLTHFLESSPDKVPYHLQVNFCRDIVLALSYLHSNGIIHRNLSSNNVLLISNVRAKVSDFGMSRLSSFDPKRSFLAHTMSSTTHPYMPPEGLRNNPNYDVKIDCFSFGVVAIQIMTRKFPSPTDRLQPLDTKSAAGLLSYTIVPEIERRKGDISKINQNHPLLQIALPCLSNDSTQRPSAQNLYKKIKKLQESDKYRKSVSDSGKSKQSGASRKGARNEKSSNELKGNQPTSGEDADANQEQMISNTMKASNSHIAEEYHDGPIDGHGAEDSEAQDVIVIVAEIHTKEDETSPEQSGPSEKSKTSEQHPSNYQDHKQKSLKAIGFDKDEETVGESVPKVQGIKPVDNSEEFIEEKVIPSPNSVDKNGDQSCKSMHEIDEHIIEDEEISKPVEDENTKSHRDSPQHENGAEAELRSKEEREHIIQTAVTMDVKREESEDTVQDSGHDSWHEDTGIQQEIQVSENDDMNKKEEERKPVQTVDAVENNLQESKHDDASVTEQPREESRNEADGPEQPEQESRDDFTQKSKPESKQDGTEESTSELESDVSVTQQSKQESKREESEMESKQDGMDESEVESKHDNAEPQKQESRQDDAQPDRESKQKAEEGKEVQTHSGNEKANNSPEITVLSQATGSDEGATKPETTSDSEAEVKKRKRKFTLFSGRKGSKSKKGAKESQENDKTEDEGSKMHGGGKKSKPKKEKEKKKSVPKAESKKSKHEKKKKQRKKSRKEMRTLMIGLDAAGKTTTLYRLKLGESVTTTPTCGFNAETVKYNKMKFAIWDVGGQDKIRPLWRHYYANTEGLVYVVDSNDRDRFGEAVQEFHRTIHEREMKDAIILVLANKQDLPDAMKPVEIQEKMGLPRLRDRIWYVQPTCAWSGDGLHEGFEWLRCQHVGKEYSPATADTLD